ncbi:MAG TPA: hypothetical protein VN643_09670 [Pyrinomonadaceae bacterium]|nr:hypothetical protein [Pyrinomonadaceae bacterium]
MFNSTILDVAIGLIFIFLLLSLMASAANELIEVILKKRAKHLEAGLLELLENPEVKKGLNGLVARLYAHPLINGLFEGPYKPGSGTLPSYIPARSFALAIMDIVPHISAEAKKGEESTIASSKTGSPADDFAPVSGAANATASTAKVASPQVVVNVGGKADSGAALNVAEVSPAAGADVLTGLRDAVESLPFEKARNALLPLIDAAGNDAVRARQNIEEWFNASMDRVSGWYKRRAQVFLFIIGLVIAVWLNADTIQIVKSLSSDKDLRAVVVAEAIEYAKENTPPANAGGAQPANPAGGTAPPASECPTPTCDKDPSSPQCKIEKNKCQIRELGLPLGWSAVGDPYRKLPTTISEVGDQTKKHFLGWLLTALAVSLGAPFWFDMLNKIIVVRSTVKPKEKSPDEPSKS